MPWIMLGVLSENESVVTAFLPYDEYDSEKEERIEELLEKQM